jgi:transcriptional regulator with XRE-family HTH domain
MTISLKLSDEFEKDMTGASFIGKKVRAAREAVGYSIEELALTCGLVVSEITAIEEGDDADLGRLKRVAAALQLQVSDLIEDQA